MTDIQRKALRHISNTLNIDAFDVSYRQMNAFLTKELIPDQKVRQQILTRLTELNRDLMRPVEDAKEWVDSILKDKSA